jgi:hypothetical protein
VSKFRITLLCGKEDKYILITRCVAADIDDLLRKMFCVFFEVVLVSVGHLTGLHILNA